MTSISVYVSQLLGEQGVIRKEDVDTCRYGIDYFIVSILEIVSVLILSLFVGNFVYTLLYFISFIPLRIYAGGYHADSKLRCYVMLLAVYGLFTVFINYFPIKYYMTLELVSVVFTVVMIIGFAPVLDSKKSINNIEANFYKKISIIIVLVESFLLLVGVFLNAYSQYVLSFSMGQLAVSTSMAAAFVKNKITGGELNEEG